MTIMLRKTLLYLAFVLYSTLSFSQTGTLQGTIIDAMTNEPINIAPKNLVMIAPESCIAYWSKKDLVPNTHLNPYTAYPMKCRIKTTKRIIPLNFSITIDSYHNSFKYSFIILSQ